MEELKKAIIECCDSDYALSSKTIDEKAEYILSVVKKILKKEEQMNMDEYCDELGERGGW